MRWPAVDKIGEEDVGEKQDGVVVVAVWVPGDFDPVSVATVNPTLEGA